jgi:hypothetical protein
MLKLRIAVISLVTLFLSLPVVADTDEEEVFPERFRMKVGVEEISTRLSKTIVFRLEVTEEIRAESWSLYIFDSPPHFANLRQFPEKALRILRGMGRVPRLASWDCKTRKGVLVPEGKYYLTLWIKDQEGQRWLSYWQSFKVK